MVNSISRFFYQPAWGLFLIRLAVGMVFIMHGLQKVGNIEGTAGFLGMIGIPFAAFMVYVLIAVEVVGGLMIITGLAMRFAAVATGIAMVVATFTVGLPNGGYAGAEWEIMLALASFGLALTGAGRLRIMSLFEHDRDNATPTMSAPTSAPTAGMGM